MTLQTETALSLALLRGGLIALQHSESASTRAEPCAALGTVLANMAYFGFAPSKSALSVLSTLSQGEIATFWAGLEPALQELTGTNRRVNDAIVYKNFPREVLGKTEADYWFAQISMYLGQSADDFAEVKAARPELTETLKLTILEAAGPNAAAERLALLTAKAASWTEAEVDDALCLWAHANASEIAFGDFPVKANAATLAGKLLMQGIDPRLTFSSPTDVLRTIAVFGGGEARLGKALHVPRFTRARRKMFVEALDRFQVASLAEDFAARRGAWRQVLMRLHPGDYRAARLNAAYDMLYRGQVLTFEGQIAKLIETRDTAALTLAAERPGIFARRLRHLHAAFGRSAFEAFLPVMPQLTTLQLLRLDRIFATLASRSYRLYAPRGQMAKAQVLEAPAYTIEKEDLAFLCASITSELSRRMSRDLPQGVALDPEVERIRFAMNGQKLAPHGRGTRFALPPEVSFLRSISWWKAKTPQATVWYDNGWNFFDSNWLEKGAICWDRTHLEGNGDAPAVFSGDPVSGHTRGVGAQAIDLYLDRLQARGVRYAAWSILCFSRKSFAEAQDVFACLQWGEDENAGEIFEPARAKLAFPIRSDEMTNVVLVVDLEAREVIYLDAPLPLRVGSAKLNGDGLTRLLPALLEVTEAQPTVADLFQHAAPGSLPVRYSDREAPVEGQAYVFARENSQSAIESFDLEGLLSAKG